MPVVFVRDPHLAAGPREQLTLVDDFQTTTIHSLKSMVAEKMDIQDNNTFVLMYGGRVLKHGKTLGDYNIVEGVTILYMKHKGVKQFVTSVDNSFNQSLSRIKLMLRNPRVFRVLRRLLTRPSLLESMLKGSKLLESSGVQLLLTDVGIKESTTNPETLIRAFESCPDQAIAVANILLLLGTAVEDVTVATGQNSNDVEGELVENMDRSVTEGEDYFGEENRRENIRRQDLADAQDQMYYHSQALQTHRRTSSQQTEPMETSSEATPPSPPPRQSLDPPQYEAMTNLSRQGSNSGASNLITQNMLANALSSIHYTQEQPPRSSQSDPPSLSSQGVPMQQSSSGPSSIPGRSSSSPIGGITPEALFQALQTAHTVTESLPTSDSSSSQQLPSGSSRPHSHSHHRTDRHHKYRKQVEQLKGMGIDGEAAIIHALEATEGDINSALELLIGRQ